MPPFEFLVARIRGEYREMPGLGLTFSHATEQPTQFSLRRSA